MAGRPRKYEDVNVAQAKAELVKMACDLFGPPYDDRNIDELERRSIREVGRLMNISEVKAKKLLIDGSFYSTKEIRRISKLHRYGLSVEEISELMGISTAKVKNHMPYDEGHLYGIGTNSAKRNQAYRKNEERKSSI